MLLEAHCLLMVAIPCDKSLIDVFYISNFNISVEGDRATSIAYVYARHYLPTEQGGNAFDVNGYYTEQLLRTESIWQIIAINFSIRWTEGNPNLVLAM